MDDGFLKLEKIVKSYNPDAAPLIKKAYEFAKIKHANQLRQSGEPYIVHPVSVAIILANRNADADTLCAALLHDTLEDTNTTKEELTDLFGPSVAMLVDGVTNLSQSRYSKKETDVANLRRIVLGMVKDIRIILIKLADRLHNIRTLQYKEPEKQKAKAFETMDFYVPIASLLGLYDIKIELEDKCLKYLKPEDYKRIHAKRKKLEKDFSKVKDEIIETLIAKLNNHQIPAEIKFRVKSIYSIYKSLREGKSYKEINDLLVFRVILEKINECYQALQYIHEEYIPLLGGMEDMIARPNGLYQAFHSTIWTPYNCSAQVQIQTDKMARIADLGATAFWLNAKDTDLSSVYGSLFDSILEVNNDADNNKEFIELLKGEVFSKKITVYDASGIKREIPAGSTALDFAYYIHSEVGNSTIAVLINGKPAELGTVLEEDSKIEIITGKVNIALDERIQMVRTRRAAKTIRETIKKNKLV